MESESPDFVNGLLVGQGRDVELDAFAGEALALPVQRSAAAIAGLSTWRPVFIDHADRGILLRHIQTNELRHDGS